MSKVKVVLAKRQEIFDIERVIASNADSAVAYPPPEQPVATHVVLDQIAANMVYVAVHQNQIVGVMIFSEFRYPWAPNTPLLQMDHLCVMPDKRNTGAGVALIRKMQQLREEHGFELFVSVTHGHDAEIKDRLFAAMGGQYLGGNFFFPAVQGTKKKG